MKTNEINIRDPFVLTCNKKYYMYGTRSNECWSDNAYGLDVYVSDDLLEWSGPKEIFARTPAFPYTQNYWAPEVHRYRDRFYMFVSFKAPGVCRGTSILAADKPDSIFAPHSNGNVTPGDWECLDGTLYVSKEGIPYMVFCHEWVQAVDGEICAIRLTEDLRAAAGEPMLLFRASEAAWVRQHSGGYVTDGPFLHRLPDGQLIMIWSSFGDEGYAMGMAKSDNGEITGRWIQTSSPMFAKDGGHGMIFKTLDNRTMTALHSPNAKLKERPVFVEFTAPFEGNAAAPDA